MDKIHFVEDKKTNSKYLEQDTKNKLLEKKEETLLDAANLDKGQQTNLLHHFERNFMQSCILELEKCKTQAVKDVIQLLYNKRLFDAFENKDQIFESYLTSSDDNLFEKYATEIQTTDGVYYLSDLDFSTRQTVLKSLKKHKYKNIVDFKYRMERIDTELNFILFKE